MSRAMIMLAAVVGAVIILAGCGKKEEEERSRLAAKVQDWEITRDHMEAMLEKLPDYQKKKYATASGRADFVDMLIEQELYFLEGKRIGLDKDREIRQKIEDAVRGVIASEYFRRYVEAKARPTDEEMHDYYEQHKDKYTTLPMIRAQHIFSKDPEKLRKLKERIEMGEKMTTLAHKYSEDEITRRDGGDLGYFNPGGYIRFVGFSKTFSDSVFALEPGVVSDPIKFEKGYSIVRVNEKRPAKLRPYDDVKDEISMVMTRQRIDGIKKKVVAELRQRYKPANYLAEDLSEVTRSAEELWNMAQASTDSYERLKTYFRIVNSYPDSKYAAQALFMVGFVYAEELHEETDARNAFNRVLQEYPESDVAKSAKWMLENLGKPVPDFEDLNELNEKLSTESQ